MAQPELIQQYLYPITPELSRKIITAREELAAALHGVKAAPLLVITGPAYLTCPVQAKACANWLNLISVENETTNRVALQSIHLKHLPKVVESIYTSDTKISRSRLLVTMRANLTKLNIDYNLAPEGMNVSSFEIERGIPMCRSILCDLAEKVPLAGQLSDTLTPQYLHDLFCLGLVSSTLVESQLHRELVSGSSFPVGFHTRDGDIEDRGDVEHKIQAAKDSVLASRSQHHFLSVTKTGQAAIIGTTGNTDTFIVLQLEDLGSQDISDVCKTILELETPVVLDVGLVKAHNINDKKRLFRTLLLDKKVSPYVLGVMIDSGDNYISEKKGQGDVFNYDQNLSFQELRAQLSSADLSEVESENSFNMMFRKLASLPSKLMKRGPSPGADLDHESAVFENIVCANELIYYLDGIAAEKSKIVDLI